MLGRLTIKNIALIDNIDVDFYKGLNVLTGETGAGKSIIIDSINAVLGSRVSKDLIRTGQEKAIVEAFFEIRDQKVITFLQENELEDSDLGLVISREFNTQGKNVCRINGRVVSLSMLKELGEFLIDIHGQHDNQSLLNSNTHIDLLDNFGGEKLSKVKEDYLELYKKSKEINQKISQLGGDQRERERRVDLLKFQLDEIESMKLKFGEDEELEHKSNIMRNAEKMVSGIEEAYDILSSGANRGAIIDGLNIVLKDLTNIQKYDSEIEHVVEKLNNIYYLIEDVVADIRNYKEELQFDPKELDSIGARLDAIYKLKRKYGNTIKEILDYSDDIKAELEGLENSQEKIECLGKELEVVDSEMRTKARELSAQRKVTASELEKKVILELEDLEMKKTQFRVNFEIGDFNTKGIDKVEFLISPNAGEDLKPLSKIASGGEMSRIMLAIKTILTRVDKIPTLIFDEIDIGISGKTAQMVGQKLSYISKNHQVLCVTHLSQIAAMADEHYLIEKNSKDNLTTTLIIKLNSEQKKHEIARILGGVEITETTLLHAQEMLDMAQQRK